MSQQYFERLIREAAERLPLVTLQPVIDTDSLTDERLAALIDHTLLKPEATAEQIRQLCREAVQYRFAAVCVNPCRAAQCIEELADSGVAVASVVGFPLGASTTETKLIEAEELVSLGVKEIDMVMNIGRLKERDYQYVFQEIRDLVDVCRGAVVKVILETCLLSEEEKIAACVLSKEAGAHFVKTSTGFSKQGAAAEDVSLMRRVVGTGMGVKAAGGIRDRDTAVAMLQAGADRIGTSSSPAIIEGK